MYYIGKILIFAPQNISTMKTKFFPLYIIICLLITTTAHAQWRELGGNNSLAADAFIDAVCRDASGNTYAAGDFTNGVNIFSGNKYVAKYNGTSWSELGGANALSANDVIKTICTDPSGNVYAAGEFTNAGGQYYVAKWNGSGWSELGGSNSLNAYGYILSICSDPSGNIYAAGSFTTGGYNYVAKWNGTGWSALGGTGLAANNDIQSICCDASGNIYAAGKFTNSNAKCYVAKYNGSSWSEVGGSNALAANTWINAICLDPSGNIYAAGDFTNGTNFLNGNYYVAKYNGTSWGELGGTNALAANNYIYSLCSDAAGNVYAGGKFSNGSVYYVAKYNGTAWSALNGPNTLNAYGIIYSLCSDTRGSIYAGGEFANTNGNCLVAKYIYPTFAHLLDTTCQGHPVSVGGFSYASSGTYIDTLTNINGGDSIVTLGLHVIPSSHAGISDSICAGHSFSFGGHTLTTAGSYSDTLRGLASTGCDSIVTLQLTVLHIGSSFSHSICADSSYTFAGHILTAAGTYYDTLTSVYGCDSIVTLQLTVHTLPAVSLDWASLVASGALNAFAGDTVWCATYSPHVFALSGGSPAGGIYSGNNVLNDTLTPVLTSTSTDTVVYFYTDANGCHSSAVDTFQQQACEGIAIISAQPAISLYPNPASGTVTISSAGIFRSIRIIDQTGEIVLRADDLSSSEYTLSVALLAKGIYYVQVTGSDDTAMKKLIVE